MLSNYLKIALRGLWKNKAQSAILVGGLAAGMAACVLLLQYVGYELSFDTFHTKGTRIYRVVNERFQEGKSIQKGTITYPTIGDAMAKDFPEIANHTRMIPDQDVFMRYGDKLTQQERVLWTDEHFLEMFDFQLLTSADHLLLSQPNEIAVSRSVAAHYFPEAKDNFNTLIGKEMFLGTEKDAFRISAVFEDVPANSFLKFNVLGSFATIVQQRGKEALDSWVWSDFWHFIELKPGADAAALAAKFPAFSERYFQGNKVSGSTEVFSLQALKDAHLYSQDLEYEIGETANGKAVWALLIIAFFILVIAWINYVNLASVRAIERAREVGVRKAIGARRGQLIGQFMTEALLVNVSALALAFPLVQLIKPWFAANFGLQSDLLSLSVGGDYLLPAVLTSLILGGIILSGAYPAWLLSSSPVAGVLKGFFQKSLGGGTLRKGLVVFQFSASIALMTATWLVSRQISFMSGENLGVDIDQVLSIDPPSLTAWDSSYIRRMDAFEGALKAHSGVRAAAASNRVPGDEFLGRVFNIQKSGEGSSGQSYTSGFINTDYHYAETYQLQPLAGRFFQATDHSPDWDKLKNIVLSAAAVKMLGYASAEDALGKNLRFWDHQWTVVGVLPDFHQKSLHHPIEPLVFLPSYSTQNHISLRVGADNLDKTIAYVKATFDSFFPGNVFKYAFVNERFQKSYEADIRFGNILRFFTLLTMLVACLGLFGLASYTTILRTPEIGIRKVLGATASGITNLLVGDFIKLVCIAILIASPLAYYFMQQWLAGFAYHTDMPWWLFPASGLAAIAIACLTVGFQSVKVALMNPVKSLRRE